MADPARSLRDRAYLALLLLVGAGALGSGLFQILAEGNAGAIPVFDTVLGVAVLMVTWLFLVPLVAPTWVGDPAPGSVPLIRPYLPMPVRGAADDSFDDDPRGRGTSAGRGSRGAAAAPEPEIPRWADPMVGLAPGPLSAVAAPAPRAQRPPPEPPVDELDPVGDLPEEKVDPLPEEFPAEIAPEATEDPQNMVRELDLISAEIENPPKKRPFADHAAAGFAIPGGS